MCAEKRKLLFLVTLACEVVCYCIMIKYVAASLQAVVVGVITLGRWTISQSSDPPLPIVLVCVIICIASHSYTSAVSLPYSWLYCSAEVILL